MEVFYLLLRNQSPVQLAESRLPASADGSVASTQSAADAKVDVTQHV
jgi:hypothetical protein